MKEYVSMNSMTIYHNNIAIKIGVYLFKEENFYIVYSPSLVLTGYSHTEERTKNDFEFIPQDRLEEQVNNNTLNHELQSHGWKTGREEGRELSVDIIPNREEIDRIINIPEYTKLLCPCNFSVADILNTYKLNNMKLSLFMEFLTDMKCGYVGIKGGHDKWRKNCCERPAIS